MNVEDLKMDNVYKSDLKVVQPNDNIECAKSGRKLNIGEKYFTTKKGNNISREFSFDYCHCKKCGGIYKWSILSCFYGFLCPTCYIESGKKELYRIV